MKFKRLILLLIVFLGLNIPHLTAQTQDLNNFTDWCVQRDKLSTPEQNTVEALLEVSETQNCQEAYDKLLNLTELDLSDRQIETLKPLSVFTQLESLRLNQNKITDLSPITSLVKLKTLYLDNNQIQDLSPVSKFTQLESLRLNQNKIKDLSPSSNLIDLTELYLHENQITDLSPITPLVKLKTLYLDNNQIQDLNPVSNLRSLNTLFANQNQIESLEPIKNLPNLTQLYLADNQITNLHPLESLSDLTHLHLGNNRITNPDSLARLQNLVELRLNHNQITTADSLSSLQKLTEFDLRNNPILRKTCPVMPATICEFTDDAAELNFQGKQQIEQGEFRAALDTFEIALNVYQKVSDTLRESDTLDTIGNLYDELGEYANSLDYYQQASKIRTEIGDRQGESLTLTNLGVTYIRIGQLEKAINSLKKAREISQSLTDQDRNSNRPQPPKGRILRSLALAYQKLGEQPQEVLRLAKQSLADYRRFNDRLGEAIALNRVGEAYLAVGNLEKARLYLEKALNLAQQEGDRPGIARSFHNLGNLANQLGDSSTALSQYQQARQLRQTIGDQAGEGESLNAIGELFLQTGQRQEAVKALQSTVKLWESLRPDLTDENKISIADIQANTYRLLQQAFVNLGDTEAALEVSEQGRARAFAELLAYRLSLRGETPPAEQFQPPTISQIKNIAQRQNATLVEYSHVGNDLYIWVIEPTGQIHFRRQSLDEKPLETWVAGYRQALDLRGRNEGYSTIERVENPKNSTGYKTLQQSYQLLVQPIADFLPQNPETPVIIIPQGQLFLIPFAALPDENGVDFLEKHPLLYAPAISLLTATPPNHDSLRIGKDPALVVGNPDMPNDPNEGKPLQQLFGAEQEALEIAPILQTQPLIGADATKAAVLSKINDVAIAHFATHGLLDDLGTGIPGVLALTPTATDTGFLKAADIFNLPLKARLVVLSACDTGRGNITGDGVIGLSRSFLSAGVETVIVSLWSVSDESTAQLMAEFYRQLQQNSNRAIALRQAMLTTRQLYRHQSKWAAFALFGQTGD